jgi:hypothetical protein
MLWVTFLRLPVAVIYKIVQFDLVMKQCDNGAERKTSSCVYVICDATATLLALVQGLYLNGSTDFVHN